MTNSNEKKRVDPILLKILITCIGGLILLYFAGYFAGYLVGTLESGRFSGKNFVMLAGSLLIVCGTLFVMIKAWPAKSKEPVAPRVIKARNWVYIALALGVVLGVFFAISMGDNPGEFALYSNSPIAPWVAAIGIAAWVIIVPVVTWVWWQSIDEHESLAYRDGAVAALHIYLFFVPAWWLAARAGWVAPQDPMIVYLVVAAIWCAAWFYRKYF